MDALVDLAIGQLLNLRTYTPITIDFGEDGLWRARDPVASQPDNGDALVSSITKFRWILASRGLDIRKTEWDFDQNAGFWDHFAYDMRGQSYCKRARQVQGLRELLRTEVEDHLARTKELLEVLDLEMDDEDESCFRLKCEYLALQGKLIKVWKNATNIVFAKHYRTDRPPVKIGIPGLSFLPRCLRVAVGQWRNKGNRRDPRVDTKVYTLFQGFKKGLLPVRPDAITAQLNGHQASLAKEQTLRDEGAVTRVINAIGSEFKLHSAIKGSRPHVACVSARASVESNFASGGSVGYGFTNVAMDRGGSGLPIQRLAHLVLGRSDQFFYYAVRLDRWAAPREVRGFELFDHELAETQVDYRFEKSAAVPACILEPMKVRVITKPRALQYAPLQFLQKKLWKALAKHDSETFLLTSTPVTQENLERFVFRSRWTPGDKFVSGDYSAATDNLKGRVSVLIARELLLRHLGPEYEELKARIESSLCGGRILYRGNGGGVFCPRDDAYAKLASEPFRFARNGKVVETLFPHFGDVWSSQLKEDEIQQRNGQLMGNVLSFPLLCIANLACFWLACEEYEGRELRFEDLPPVRINGDDILFKSPSERFLRVWTGWTKEFGFELSVGKNLVSDHILQINSALYTTKTTKYNDFLHVIVRIQEVPFVNFGLITNRKKNDCSNDFSLQRTGLDNRDRKVPGWVYRVSQAPQIVRDLVRGLDPEFAVRAMKLYQHHNRWIAERVPMLPWGLLLDREIWSRPWWLKQLERAFSVIVPKDPLGVCRQHLCALSYYRKLEPSWEDEDCYESYRQGARRPFYCWDPCGWRKEEEGEDTWGTPRIARPTWIDLSRDGTTPLERIRLSDISYSGMPKTMEPSGDQEIPNDFGLWLLAGS
jgi:hypothetical protein